MGLLVDWQQYIDKVKHIFVLHIYKLNNNFFHFTYTWWTVGGHIVGLWWAYGGHVMGLQCVSNGLAPTSRAAWVWLRKCLPSALTHCDHRSKHSILFNHATIDCWRGK